MNILISLSYRDYIKKKYVIYSIWDKKLRLNIIITQSHKKYTKKYLTIEKNVRRKWLNVSFNFKSKYFDPIDFR